MFGLFRKRKSARADTMRANYRPCLEALEDRFVPSTAGALDPTFGNAGLVVGPVSTQGPGTGLGINKVVIQPDGKIVAVGIDGGGRVIVDRFNANGSLDKTFNGSGQAVLPLAPFTAASDSSVALAPDGKIVVVTGTSYENESQGSIVVARFDSNGTLDSTFGTAGMVETSKQDEPGASSVLVQPDGKIVVGGVVVGTAMQSFNNAVLQLRFTPGGQLDTSFGSGGEVVTVHGPTSVCLALALQPDGKIVEAGTNGLSRYNTNGSLDSTFGSGGNVVATSSEVEAVVIQGDGKIVAVGGRRSRTPPSNLPWPVTTPTAAWTAPSAREARSSRRKAARSLELPGWHYSPMARSSPSGWQQAFPAW